MTRSIHFRIAAFAAFAVSFGATLVVSTPVRAQQRDTTTLNTVVVTATKSPVHRNELSQSVTVINGADLRARGVARVSDALLLVPGATPAQNGSFGSVSSLFLRGGESRYTKVLIDGVAVNQSGGFFDFSHLTTDNIDRIEIVRGPGSVLYGADAITGVIQIFTRRGRGPRTVNASGRGGTYRTIDGDAGVSGSTEALSYSIAGAGHSTDGILPFNNQYLNETVSASLGSAPDSVTDSRISARYTTAEFHYPTDFTGAPVDSNSYRVQHRFTIGLDGGRQLTSGMRTQLLAGANEVSDITEDIAPPFGSTTPEHSADKSRAHRRNVEGRVAFALPSASSLNLGAEYVWEGETSTSTRGPVGAASSPASSFAAARTTGGLYAELLGRSETQLTYTAAIRLDDNSDYGSHATYRLGASVPLSPVTRVLGSLSTAFNAPAFNQIRATLFSNANPNLLPERSRSWEVGIEQTLVPNVGKFSATLFRQRFGDLIQFLSGGPPTFVGTYENLAEATSNGYEAELELTPPGVMSASASVTVATPRVTRVSASSDNPNLLGQALIRRPTHSATASLTIAPPGRSLSIVASYIGKRPDVDFNEFPSPTVTLPAYTRVDLSSSTEIWRGARQSSLSLTVRVENALDRQYETVLHFPAPRRVLLLGARFSGSL